MLHGVGDNNNNNNNNNINNNNINYIAHPSVIKNNPRGALQRVLER